MNFYHLFSVVVERVLVLNYALLSFIEKWKVSLVKKGHTGAVLMDLSKAFNAINDKLLYVKMHEYGFSKNVLKILLSISLTFKEGWKLKVH